MAWKLTSPLRRETLFFLEFLFVLLSSFFRLAVPGSTALSFAYKQNRAIAILGWF